MRYTYRPATPDDARATSDIIRAFVEATPWWPRLGDFDGVVTFWAGMIARHPAWVAETDHEVVGFCLRDDDNIGALYVAHDHRNAGIGKHLLDLAKEGRDRITVWAFEQNTRARAFYAREGLVEIYYEPETFHDGTTLMNIEHLWTR